MKYSSVFLICLFLITSFQVDGQILHNMDFTERCDTSQTGLCFWKLSWGAKESVRPDLAGTTLCLLIHGTTTGDVGFTEQAASIQPLTDLHVIKLYGSVRSENVEGKGAGLNINLYDQDGQLLTFKDMGGLYSIDWITGTSKWKEYSITLVAPAGTAKIQIGAILFVKGNAWFNNFRVEVSRIENRPHSKFAKRYINEACDTIHTYSLVRDSIDIEKMRTIALNIAGPAASYLECYPAIHYLIDALREYGDYHSFFMRADEVENWKNEGSAVSKIEYPTYMIWDECGYINIPPFHGGNQTTILAYADSLQNIIRKLDTMNIKGWMIDLRMNTGGNMEPMIAGLGPFFSSEKLGALIDVNHTSNAWYYKNGKYYWDGVDGWSVSNPVMLKSKRPIAVMTSHYVGSSGEIVFISFIGNANTKSFGQPTMGLTTGNGSFDLADGSRIYLSSTIMADRNNKPYYGSISPDVVIEEMVVDRKDVVMEKAAEWIKRGN